MKNQLRKLARQGGNAALALLGSAAVAFALVQSFRTEAARVVQREALEKRDGRLFLAGEDRPFNGILTEFYPEGGVKSCAEIENGRLHGRCEGYYKNGRREIREHFRKGVSHGLRTRWSKNGSKQSEGEIRRGEYHGLYRQWHSNGRLAQKIPFHQGRPDGLCLAWHPDGSLQSKALMRAGEAVERQYWAQGETQTPAEYETGS